MDTVKTTFNCACGKEGEARTNPLYRILFRPMICSLAILFALGMSLLIDWLLMEILCHYGLQYIHEMLSGEKWWFLYTIGLLTISGWFVFQIIAQERNREEKNNGLEIFYARCQHCKRRLRFIKHTPVHPRPWVEVSFFDDEEYEEG